MNSCPLVCNLNNFIHYPNVTAVEVKNLKKSEYGVRSLWQCPTGASPRAQLRAQRRRRRPRAPRPPRAPRAPPLTPAENTFAQHECWPNNDCDTGIHSLGKITHFPILPAGDSSCLAILLATQSIRELFIPTAPHLSSSATCSKGFAINLNNE